MVCVKNIIEGKFHLGCKVKRLALRCYFFSTQDNYLYSFGKLSVSPVLFYYQMQYDKGEVCG
jgi:hypothetical protein